MSVNKQTVEKYMDGFRNSDHERILSCLADDVVWDIPGYLRLEGKEQFDKEIENENFVGRPAISVTRMVEEGNIVVAEGTVQSKMKSGGILDAVFCDVFHLRDGKIVQLTSYLVIKHPV